MVESGRASATTTRRTRLIATIGPASVGLAQAFVAAGLDVARINLAHGTEDEHQGIADAIRGASTEVGRPVGLLVDLPGPKLRLGSLPDGKLRLEAGVRVGLIGPADDPGAGRLPLGDSSVLAVLRPGDRILLADGAAELNVVSSGNDQVVAEVVRGGVIGSRQGVSVPAERVMEEAVGKADEVLIPHLLALQPDFVGQSFVRSAADVEALRSHLPADVRIVAKIETRPAVEQIDAIVDAADAIMVARGDLGVELPFEHVPFVQKELVRSALRSGRPSIVATQLLESMVKAPRPTRAEASDVANAILDGADAVMLSAETAVGAFPLEALRAAADIAAATDGHEPPTRPPAGSPSFGADVDARALAVAAVAMADDDPDVVALACYTHSGRTPRRLASLRPGVRIVAFTPTAACARSLTLLRGVQPIVMEVERNDPVGISDAVTSVLKRGRADLTLGDGKAVVLVQTSARGGPNALELLRI